MTRQPGPGGKAVGRHSGTGVNPVKVLCNKIQDWKIGKRETDLFGLKHRNKNMHVTIKRCLKLTAHPQLG